MFSYFSISDSLIGSIFYFTTSLHGIHVLLGSFNFFLLLINSLFTINCFSIEFSFTIYLISLY